MMMETFFPISITINHDYIVVIDSPVWWWAPLFLCFLLLTPLWNPWNARTSRPNRSQFSWYGSYTECLTWATPVCRSILLRSLLFRLSLCRRWRLRLGIGIGTATECVTRAAECRSVLDGNIKNITRVDVGMILTCVGTSGEPGVAAVVGGVYCATRKPKNSWPKGRLRAAGTLISDSKVLLDTIRWLL